MEFDYFYSHIGEIDIRIKRKGPDANTWIKQVIPLPLSDADNEQRKELVVKLLDYLPLIRVKKPEHHTTDGNSTA